MGSHLGLHIQATKAAKLGFSDCRRICSKKPSCYANTAQAGPAQRGPAEDAKPDFHLV